MNYHPLNRILSNNQIVLVDGITRTGKLLLGSLVSSLDNMEHLEFGENFEFLLPALKFKKIKIDFANAYLNNYLNQIIYNKFISRNVNFRVGDRTSIENSRNPNVYYKRLKVKEGSSVIDSIKKNKVLLPFVTHDIAVNLDLLFKMKMDFKIIEIIRSPVDTVYSWYKRGLGKRFGKDQRMFTLLINKKNTIGPWYGALNKKKENNFSECEKCIYHVLNLNYYSNKNLYKYRNKKNLFITSYEKLTTKPKSELNKISIFLKTKINKKSIKFIKKENLPIKNDLYLKNNYLKKINIIKKLSSNELFKKLMKLESEYKKNYHKLLIN